jgi:hypothetical protein
MRYVSQGILVQHAPLPDLYKGPTGQSHMNFGYPRRIQRRGNYFISFRATDHLDTSIFSHFDGVVSDV